MLARSDDSNAESAGDAVVVGVGRSLDRSVFDSTDRYTTNVNDAGMRVVLPGANGTQNTYHVRVRSRGASVNSTSDGLTTGSYELQIRLREADEVPGTTVRFADIRNAVNGIEILGQPAHSPLLGETGETTADNDTRANAQPLGNVIQSDRGAIVLTGSFSDQDDLDWYQFDAILPSTQRITAADVAPEYVAVTFDVDFTDGFGRPNTAIWIYDEDGNLVYSSEDSAIADDRPAQSGLDAVSDLTAGSVGAADPFLGTVELREGTYFMAVTSERYRPSVLTEDPLLRAEPINSLIRIAEDRIGYSGGSNIPEGPIVPILFTDDFSIIPAQPSEIQDGESFIITNENGESVTYEFDSNGIVDGTNVPVTFDPTIDFLLGGFFTGTVSSTLQAVINANGPAGVTAGFGSVPDEVTLTGARGVKTNAAPNGNPSSLFVSKPSNTPFRLGDVTLFVTQDSGRDQTRLITVDPYTGTQETTVGIFDANVEDIAIRPTGFLHGFSVTEQDPNIGNLGNYWQIDPRSQATQALGANLGDDGITTWWIDPANPGAPAQVDDGVIFQAITLGGGIRDGLTGFAVGHRGLIDPNGVAGPTRNLLYEFNVDTGAAQNADGSQDRADVELVQGGGTQIRERGQLDLFVDPFGFGNTSLSIPEVTIINTAGQTVPFVTDGLQFTLDDGVGNSFNFEFNSGPEVQYQHTPGADIYVRDGDTFLLDGNAFEFDTGSVVVVTAENGNGIADGETLTITDNQVPPVTRTFEFDDGSGGPIGAGNVRLTFDSSFNQQAIINTIVNGINAVGNFNIDAQQLAATNRISLLGESNVLGAVSTSSGMIIQGTPGGSGALVHVEEVMDSVEFGAAVSADVPGASAEGTRMNFSGYTTADFRQIASRGVFQQVLTSDGDVTPGFIGIDFLAAESGNQTAVRAAAVVNASTTMTATSLGGALVVNAPASVTFAQDPLRIGGTAPGGDITGLAIVNGSIYGVTAPGPDGGGGGLYRIVSPLSNFAVADYIETATDLLTGGRDQFGNPTGGPIEFAALSAGPDNIYDGEYAELLFAMDVFGNMYAFDLEGNLQPVFLDSNSSVSTGITNATGFAFSTLDMNLWHPTSERRNDAGHGYNRPQDLSRIAEPQGGNSSLYFGFGNPQNTPGNWGGVNDPGNRNNYDFPGGAHGSIESNTFDLSDYSPIDSPALFFNYLLETDEGIGDAGPPPFMTDSFRVFVSADDGEWQLLATNNSFRANGTADDEFDYGGLVTVQEALDNVGWRQMQVDLSPLAGESNVRLRFDFNSAGAFDLGNPLTGGVELRAIDADQISDGDALVLNDGTFEFDFGYMLLAPTGSSVTDGETFEVNDGVNLPVNYEFDLGDGVRPGNVPISYNTGMSSAELAVAIESGILAGFGDGLVQLDLTREDNDVFSDAGRHGLGAGTVVANGSIGDNPILFGANAGRDVDFIELNLTAGQRVTIDVDTDPSSFTSLTNSHIRLFDADGVQVAANANGAAPGEPLFTSDSYLDFTAPGGGIYYLGVSGGGNVNYDPQVAGSGGQGATGDYRVEITMFGVDSDVAIRRSNAVLDLDNVVNLTLGQNSSLQVIGTPGTNFGTPINLDITMSDDQVAWAVRTAIATEFGSGDPNGIPGYGDVVQLLGHTVINPGPLGVSATGFFDEDELPGFSFDIEGLDGDIFGAFDASTLQNGATNANFPGAIRGWNNDFEGVYIDDIVIGFAERGLMYTDVDGGNDQFTQIPIRDTRPNILVGDYTIEIRPSEYYGVFLGTGLDIELALTEAFDPRDRFTDGVTLNVAPGAQISDGTTISIGDGSNEVLFEFEDRTLGNGIRRNHVAVPYSNLDSSAVVANTLAATINSLLVQREIDVRAETPTGSNRIELFGNAVVNPNTGARTGLVTEPSDTISTAISSGVGVDGGQRFTALGTIGDNTEIGAGLDVDFLSFSLEAGDEVNIDVDSLDVPVDTMLNLFDANGTLLAASDDDPGPGEQPSLEPFISFTATTAGDYFVGISGFSNRDYDPNVIGSGIAVQNLGDYKVEVSVGGSDEILEVLVSDRRGDANPFRDQGQVIIDSARVTNSSGFGILIDEGARDAEDFAPHQGTPRVLFNTNEERLFTGVTVKNNVVAFNREGGIRYSGDPGNAGEPLSPVSFGRIVNNTIVGGGAQVISGIRDNSPSGIGIQVDENSSPTLLNNIITNFQIGIAVDATSQSTVIGATLFKDNLANSNKGLGQDAILLSSNDPLFVNGEEGNFYLDENSMAIDSSINSVADRSNYSNLTSKLGSPVSPILAPDYDITGLLRVDDPRVDTPAGQGENVFKDRGAIDRADFIGPQAVLINPQDNDVDGKDQNPGNNIVQINNPVMRSFQIQLQDGITESQTQRGAGIDETTVTIDSVTVMQNGTVLTEGVDYLFSYDSASRVIQLTPLSGIWQPGRVYEIEINNSADGGIRDKASNLLQPNTDLGLTRFTISIGGEEQDFGDAPAQYPTELLNNGASHVIQSGVFLGSRIDRESDGTPSADASADAGDDGVEFESSLVPGRDAEIVVTASRAGKLNAWIDFNMDGDWNDGGEQVLTDADTVAGANTYSIAVPAGNSLAATFARFRFNTEGGLTPTGLALDGEVEDYQVDIVSATPWQNPSEPMDVTSDGNVVPMDVLRIINELNNRTIVSANGRLPNPPVAPNGPEQLGYLDVDGDGFVSPRDALLIINRLNAANDAEGEFDPRRPLAAVAVVGNSVDAPEVRAALEYSDQRSAVRISDVLRTTTAFVGADEQAASLEDASVDSLFESSNSFDEHDAADDLLSDVYDENVESI